jgi:hypothetical protein
MTRLRTLQTNFTGGEIAESLYGRGDLRAYQNGAAELTNVVIEPTGGVTRRPGLRFIDNLPSQARLLALVFNVTEAYLVALTDGHARIYEGETLRATIVAPWTADQLDQIGFTQSAESLLICHPDVEPQILTRSAPTAWSLAPWRFAQTGLTIHQPYFKFVDDDVLLNLSGTHPNMTGVADTDVFVPDHVGTRLDIAGTPARIVSVTNPTTVELSVEGPPFAFPKTAVWAEQAWSAVRGWPMTVTFYQRRLVVGGSRDLPNRLWMSKTGDFFNLDLAEGLDDEPIEFPILSDQANVIRGLVSGRDLQVFTSGAEWLVTGQPLTPATVQLFRQTQVGSPMDRLVPPRQVDGATLFVSRDGRQVREFLFADVEQAYQATDRSLLSPHLLAQPIDMDHDGRRRLVLIANRNGPAAAITLYRAEGISGWTRFATSGQIRALAVVSDEAFAAIEEDGTWRLERFDDALALDSAVTLSLDPPGTLVTGLDHLEGLTVRVIADGQDIATATVTAGQITLAEPAGEVVVGRPFSHAIAPLPPFMRPQAGGSQGIAMRPIETLLRLYRTGALRIDLGDGALEWPLATDPGSGLFTGDTRLRQRGWTQNATAPFWRIDQDAPAPFTLLMATTETKVND